MSLQNCNTIPLWSFVIPFSNTCLDPFLANDMSQEEGLAVIGIASNSTYLNIISLHLTTSTVTGLDGLFLRHCGYL